MYYKTKKTRSLKFFQRINEKNSKLNPHQIRKEAGKCGEYFTDEEINKILKYFIDDSKKVLESIDIIEFMRYNILYTNWLWSNSENYIYMAPINGCKYGDYSEFSYYIENKRRRSDLFSKNNSAIIDKFDNYKYFKIIDKIDFEEQKRIDTECDDSYYWSINNFINFFTLVNKRLKIDEVPWFCY